jgi:hypothetical protein
MVVMVGKCPPLVSIYPFRRNRLAGRFSYVLGAPQGRVNSVLDLTEVVRLAHDLERLRIPPDGFVETILVGRGQDEAQTARWCGQQMISCDFLATDFDTHAAWPRQLVQEHPMRRPGKDASPAERLAAVILGFKWLLRVTISRDSA